MKNIENKRQDAWNDVTGSEDQFLETLDIADKQYGERLALTYWKKLEDIHEKYNYWRIYPKDNATIESVNNLKDAAKSIRTLNSELRSKLYKLDEGSETLNRKKKSTKAKPKRIVKKCKCKR